MIFKLIIFFLSIAKFVKADAVNFCTNCTGACFTSTNVTIPSDITTIDYGAFSDCQSLQAVVIPTTVTSIKGEAFYNCPNLTRVVIPSSVTYLGFASFSECSNLKSVVLPNFLSVIPASLFEGCKVLETVVIPSHVSAIEKMAFARSGLKRLHIPSSVTDVSEVAFFETSSLQCVSSSSEGNELSSLDKPRCASVPTSGKANYNLSLVASILIVVFGAVVICVIVIVILAWFLRRDIFDAFFFAKPKMHFMPVVIRESDRDRESSIRSIVESTQALQSPEDTLQFRTDEVEFSIRNIIEMSKEMLPPSLPFANNLEEFCKKYPQKDLIDLKFLKELLKSNVLNRNDFNGKIFTVKMISLLIVFEDDWIMLTEYCSTINSFLSQTEVHKALRNERDTTRREVVGPELVVLISTHRGSVAASEIPVSEVSADTEEDRRRQFIEALNTQVYFGAALAKMSLLFASANHSHSEVTLPDHFHPLFTTIKSMMDLQAPKKSNVPELDFSVDKVILFCCAAFSDLAEVPSCRNSMTQEDSAILLLKWLHLSKLDIEKSLDYFASRSAFLTRSLDNLNTSERGILTTHMRAVEEQFKLAHMLLLHASTSLRRLSLNSLDQELSYKFLIQLVYLAKDLILLCANLTVRGNSSTSGYATGPFFQTSSDRGLIVSHLCNSLYSFFKIMRGRTVDELVAPNEFIESLLEDTNFSDQFVSSSSHRISLASHRSALPDLIDESIGSLVTRLCDDEMIRSLLIFLSNFASRNLGVVRLLTVMTEFKNALRAFENFELEITEFVDSICIGHELSLEADFELLRNPIIAEEGSQHGSPSAALDLVILDNESSSDRRYTDLPTSNDEQFRQREMEFDSAAHESGYDRTNNDFGDPNHIVVCACYLLANLCRSENMFVDLVIEKSLFLTIKKIIFYSQNVRVCNQSVRCMDIICQSLVQKKLKLEEESAGSESLSGGVESKSQEEHTESKEDAERIAAEVEAEAESKALILREYRDIIETLTLPLLCKVVSVQRYALASIRSIVQLDSSLQIFVVEKVLSKIIELYLKGCLDPSIEFTIQEILFSIGFDGGLKDLNSCENNYETMLIWHRVKQSLRQQSESLCMLKHWISSVFYPSSSVQLPAPTGSDYFSNKLAIQLISTIIGSDTANSLSSYAARTISAYQSNSEISSLGSNYDQNYPTCVSYQWSVFMPSQLQRLLHMGLLSFRQEQQQANSPIINFVIPDCNGVLLHRASPRCLKSMDKLMQNIVSETAKKNLQEQWLLSFEDCQYSEEFHEKLLDMLHRCPQVCSLSFHDSEITTGTILGQQLAKLPHSVNFLSFCGTITKLQIQILCTYLRVRNGADNNTNAKSSSEELGHQSINKSFGLRGLAFIDLKLTDSVDAFMAIIKLIEPEPTVPPALTNGFSSLRYIDLSRNDLSDEQCASILGASLRNGIEGLELAGNNIYDADAFVSRWELFFIEYSKLNLTHSLRYLGISRNNLTNKGVVSISECIGRYPGSLTYMDMSWNNISRDESTALREMIKSNQVLRILELSHNNLNCEDTVVQLQLGIADNMSLVLVPMVGNEMSADALGPLNEVQNKLRDNRVYIGAAQGSRQKRRPFAEYVANISPLPLDPKIADEMKKIHVLFSTPLVRKPKLNEAPIPLDVLDYDKEVALMESIFIDTKRNVGLHFDFATTTTLTDSLRRNCSALHFSCHGNLDGLFFEDGRGGMHVFTEMRLRGLLKTQNTKALQFVFVSACQSRRIGETFINAGVPYVVCILDTAAILFTSSFYKSLLFGKTVKESFDIAIEELLNSPGISRSEQESGKFILLDGFFRSRSANTPLSTKNIFGDCQTLVEWPYFPEHCTIGPKRKSLSVFRQFTRLPAMAEVFEGREIAMYELIRNVFDRKLVFFTGSKGVGKSAMTIAVCKYITDRELLKDGIYFHRGTGLRNYGSFLSSLKTSLKNSGSNDVSAHLKGLDSSRELEIAISASPSNLQQYPDEEIILNCLVERDLLLVFDEMDDYLQSGADSTARLNRFLVNIFDRAKNTRVLVVCRDNLKKWKVENVGKSIVESSLLLQPLSLESSLRLYALLAPFLVDIPNKEAFINGHLSKVPPSQRNLCVSSKDVLEGTLSILREFKNGNPGDIVDLVASRSDQNSNLV